MAVVQSRQLLVSHVGSQNVRAALERVVRDDDRNSGGSVTTTIRRSVRLFCGDETSRTAFVKERVHRILRGEVLAVVQGLRSLATRHKFNGKRREEVDKVCAYFENNADRMHYDQYLAKGYPIATGVIEGACRHVVRTGWNVPPSEDSGKPGLFKVSAARRPVVQREAA